MFWKDIWLGKQNFQSKYPVLYHLTLKKEAFIADFGIRILNL